MKTKKEIENLRKIRIGKIFIMVFVCSIIGYMLFKLSFSVVEGSLKGLLFPLPYLFIIFSIFLVYFLNKSLRQYETGENWNKI